MNSEGVNLLRRLGSGVIPAGPERLASRTLEGSDFPTLLVEAGAGALRTGRALATATTIEPGLSPQQLRHLADAADLAQASGAGMVVAMIDDRALTLDVARRRITGEVPLDAPARTPSDVLDGIDAVVVARNTIDTERDGDRTGAAAAWTTPEAARRLAASLTQIQNRSVAELLAGDPETRRAG
ncbi:MAG: hypothetical protein H6814_08500 [Phycisphaeraceae bacterium]|nr:hypothetical protein [Phycisphaeraceae bacterium]